MSTTAIVLLLFFVFGAGLFLGSWSDNGEGPAGPTGFLVVVVVAIVAVTRLCVIHF